MSRAFDYGSQADGVLDNEDEIVPESNDADDEDCAPAEGEDKPGENYYSSERMDAARRIDGDIR